MHPMTPNEKELLLGQLRAIQKWFELNLDINCITPIGDNVENLIILIEDYPTRYEEFEEVE